jgi:glycerol-3-phosphate acyltransferase PlsY
MIVILSISVVITYLCGSIPFAYIYGKLFKKVDIREFGSGNIGATNVLRTFGFKAGLLVLLFDILKGFLPVFIFLNIIDFQWISVVLAFCAIMGHTYTCFLRFKGGKGVATAAGVMFAIQPLICFLAIIVFALILYITRYVSVGSISAAFFLILTNIFSLYSEGNNIYEIIFCVLLGLFIIYKHKENIKRLINKNENKFLIKKVSKDT